MSQSNQDPQIALILEIIPGLFGLLGIGWIYNGKTTAGVAWLVSGLIWEFIALIIIALTAGVGCFCTIPINLVLVGISASMLNSHTGQNPQFN